MKMHVVGMRKRQTGNYNGKDWAHTKIYVTHPDDSISGLSGEVAEMLKIPDSINLSGIQVGDDVEVTFSRYGAVTQLDLAI